MLQKRLPAETLNRRHQKPRCHLCGESADKKEGYGTIDLPSTQLWSQCGNQIKEAKELNERVWEYSVCCSHHDRDKNASINILIEGLFLLSGKKKPQGLRSLVANEFTARPSGPVSLGKLRPVSLSTRNPAKSLAGSSNFHYIKRMILPKDQQISFFTPIPLIYYI